MANIALEPTPAPVATPALGFRPYRVTIDRYHRMIDAGVFTASDPVFLWKGWLVEKMPKGRLHTRAGKKLYDILVPLVPGDWHVLQEQPITFSDDTEPEPDLAVVRGTLDDYPTRPPTAREVSMLAEVADSSLTFDSGAKLEGYALEAIPIYWLVNIPRRRIEVYRRPEGARYAECQVYGPDDEVPVILDGRAVGAIAVRDVLP